MGRAFRCCIGTKQSGAVFQKQDSKTKLGNGKLGRGHPAFCSNLNWFSSFIYGGFMRFPKMGVPPNHPLYINTHTHTYIYIIGCSIINHPLWSILGILHYTMEPPHMIGSPIFIELGSHLGATGGHCSGWWFRPRTSQLVGNRRVRLTRLVPWLPRNIQLGTSFKILVGGLEHFLFFHILGIMIPID